MDTQEWDELVIRARAGVPYGMDDLLAAIKPMVLRRCSKFLPYRADAEEAAQEALMTIATRLDDFSGRGTFAGWVTVISSNAARQSYRSMRRRFDETTTDLVAERPGRPASSPAPGSTSSMRSNSSSAIIRPRSRPSCSAIWGRCHMRRSPSSPRPRSAP